MPEASDPSESVEPSATPASDPSQLFAQLAPDVGQGVRDLGWSKPTPVQEQVIPRMREGGDLIVQAQTGSGKTGAFGIPIAERIDTDEKHCQALVIAPTRELANQVAGEVEQIGRHRGVRCVPIYGGVGYGAQIEGIEKGAHVVVGTPGRILDHLGSGRLSFAKVRCLVFDEADELLSLGFWPDMRENKSYLPDDRQSCLFSATMPERVRSLARQFLRDPAFVSLSADRVAPREIAHFWVLTTAKDKDAALARILEHEDPDSAIVFCNTKDDVRYVTAYLKRRGFDADQISGDLNQNAREEAMRRIKAGQLRVLVATDVAARGIDISDLSHVIGYAAPQSPEVYVHRTGRTGRAGKSGIAISLVSGLDIGNFRMIQQANQIEISELKLPTDAEMALRLRERLAAKIEREMRHTPERERAWKVDRFVTVVDQLAETREGRRDLAAICAAYLQEHPSHASPQEADDDATARAVTPTSQGPRESRGDGGGGGGRGRNRRRGGRGGRSGGGGGGRGRR
jgi:ATP-dependent RNA helicase DeaD